MSRLTVVLADEAAAEYSRTSLKVLADQRTGTGAWFRKTGPITGERSLHPTRAEARSGYIEPGSFLGYGRCESFNGKLRDERQIGEMFHSLGQAQVVLGMWREHYNTVRPRILAAP